MGIFDVLAPHSTSVDSRLQDNIWWVRLTPSATHPELRAVWDGQDIPLSCTQDQTGFWTIKVPLPSHAFSSRAPSLVLLDQRTFQVVEVLMVDVVTGNVPADTNLRAELEMVRAELDMLKSAFRRHCRQSHSSEI